MSTAEERIAQLQARAQAQRLAAQLAILEANEQLAPLRSAVGLVSAAVHVLQPRGPVAGALAGVTKFGIGHPWLVSMVAAAALRGLRRRPYAVLLALAAGAGAWWLLRPPPAGTVSRGEDE